MPVSPQYEWQESEEEVTLTVSLKGVCSGAPSLFCSACCLKLNAPPYLLLIDLFEEVNESSSRAVKVAEGYTISLVKKVPGLWGQLTAAGDKASILARRNASLDAANQKSVQDALERKERRKEADKAASEKQYGVESEKRLKIEALKEEELKHERCALEEWQTHAANQLESIQEGESEESRSEDFQKEEQAPWEEGEIVDITEQQESPVCRAGALTEISSSSRAHGPTSANFEESSTLPENSKVPAHRRNQIEVGPDKGCCSAVNKGTLGEAQVWSEQELKGPVSNADDSCKPDEQTYVEQCPVRSPLSAVPLQFTKLETPHLPAREQREEELKLYKKNIKNSEGDADCLEMGDQLPVFLKDKGDTLYRQGNYKAAINAYSRALELDSTQVMSLANRSACYLRVGDQRACIADCSTVIQDLEDKVLKMSDDSATHEKKRKALVRALGRRGIARCEVDELEDAAMDFKQGLKYDPNNQELKDNLAEIKASLGPPEVGPLLQQGILRFSKANHTGAREAFTAALTISKIDRSNKVKAWSNRAACCLVLEEYENAVSDCNMALDLLLHPTGMPLDRFCEVVSLDYPIKPQETISKTGFQLKDFSRLLCRRGAAYCHMKEYTQALHDYECALGMLELIQDKSTASAIENDIAKIRCLSITQQS